MSDISELENKVWWIKGQLSLEILQKELEACQVDLEAIRKYVRDHITDENEEELFGIIPYECELERKIRCLEWDIQHWPKPI